MSRKLCDLVRDVKRLKNEHRTSPPTGAFQLSDRLGELFWLIDGLAAIVELQQAQISRLEAAQASAEPAARR